VETKEIFLHELTSKIWFRSGLHSLRRWHNEGRSAGVIYVMWRKSQTCVSRTVNWSRRLGHA